MYLYYISYSITPDLYTKDRTLTLYLLRSYIQLINTVYYQNYFAIYQKNISSYLM
jgi:hypothetical protein